MINKTKKIAKRQPSVSQWLISVKRGVESAFSIGLCVGVAGSTGQSWDLFAATVGAIQLVGCLVVCVCVFHVLRCLHINSLTFLVASATLSLSLLLPFLPSDCLSVCLHRLDQPPRSYANGERTRAQRFSLTLFSLFFPYRHDICSNRSPRQRESEFEFAEASESLTVCLCVGLPGSCKWNWSCRCCCCLPLCLDYILILFLHFDCNSHSLSVTPCGPLITQTEAPFSHFVSVD